MPKRDHYNPLFLLKNFGESLFVFDKKTRSTKQMTYTSVPAWEKGLETEDVSGFLWRIDSECSRAIDKLARTMNPVTLSDDERGLISLFAAVEMHRTKKYRDQIQTYLAGNPAEQVQLAEVINTRVDALRELANNAQARQILSRAREYAIKLFQMDWSGLKSNKPANPFWTSDNPVVAYDNLYSSKDQPGAFLDTRGIQIFFPLSPRFLLMMMTPKYYRSVNVRPVKGQKEVWKANNVQFVNADRFIFASADPTKLAELIIIETAKDRAMTR